MNNLTIIISVYNGALTISDTLLSIKKCVNEWGAQLLIIDAKSADNTINEINKCKIKHRLIQEKDDGLYFAWNKAIKLAKTDFIFFLNADDTLDTPTALKVLIDCLSENERYVCASGMTKMIRKDGKTARRGKKLKYNKFYGEMPIVTPATVFRRSALQQLGGFDTRYLIAADYDLAQRMLARFGYNRFAFMKFEIVNFSIDGMSNTQIEKVNNEIKHIVLKNYGIFGYVIHKFSMIIILLKRTLLKLLFYAKKI